jgi:ABC-type transport system involved in cytochrome c biogenesis ATPase subunit
LDLSGLLTGLQKQQEAVVHCNQRKKETSEHTVSNMMLMHDVGIRGEIAVTWNTKIEYNFNSKEKQKKFVQIAKY